MILVLGKARLGEQCGEGKHAENNGDALGHAAGTDVVGEHAGRDGVCREPEHGRENDAERREDVVAAQALYFTSPSSRSDAASSPANLRVNALASSAGMKAGVRLSRVYSRRYAGSASTAWMPSLQALRMFAGRFFGPARPRNLVTTRSSPCSFAVGTSGKS